MVVQGGKTIDMNQLIDYEELSGYLLTASPATVSM
jgi:hypothetical protein